MLTVTKHSLPYYLKNSHFLQSWNDSNEAVAIDPSVLKLDDSVADRFQLAHLLQTLQYWLVDELPMSIVEFVISNHYREQVVCTLQLYENTLPYISSLLQILSVFKEERWVATLESDCVECAAYLLKQGMHYNWDGSCGIAAKAGSLRCLQYLHQQGCPWTSLTCKNAAMCGHLNCLNYLRQHGCPWDESIAFVCAAAGHTNCLAFALKNNCPFDYRAAQLAATNGHLPVLEVMRKYDVCSKHEWNLVVAAAAEHGHLDCLRYLVMDGCEIINILAPMMAAKGGHIGCVKYLHDIGSKWDFSVTHMSASFGHLACLRYAVEHGCTWNSSALEDAANDEIISYLIGLNGFNFEIEFPNST